MTTVTIDIPDEILDHFDDLNAVRRAVYEDFIIEQRQRGTISLGRAAELLGKNYTEFFELLGQKGFSFINANRKELDESYQHFENVMSQARP
jgi:predicted HTH domain antitoxin